MSQRFKLWDIFYFNIFISAPILFKRSAISSYPRLIMYTLRSIEVPLAPSMPISIIMAGRRAGGQTTWAGFNVVPPWMYTRCGSASVILAPSRLSSVN